MPKTHDRINPCSTARLKLSSDLALARLISPLLLPTLLTESIGTHRLSSFSAQFQLWNNRFIIFFGNQFTLCQSARLSFVSKMTYRLILCYDRPFWLNQSISCSASPCISHNCLSEAWFGSSTCPFRSARQDLFNGSNLTPIRNRKRTDIFGAFSSYYLLIAKTLSFGIPFKRFMYPL